MRAFYSLKHATGVLGISQTDLSSEEIALHSQLIWISLGTKGLFFSPKATWNPGYLVGDCLFDTKSYDYKAFPPGTVISVIQE